MKYAKTITVLVATVTLFSLPAYGAGLEPLTVSPGATDRVTGVEVRCPTFSWQAVQGAVGYEVVVYELPPETELVAWSLDQAVEVLFVELPVGVTAWTPELELGLERGADHVWFVRGVMGEDEATEWSGARFFRVAGGSSSGTGTGTGTGTDTVAATATATATAPATVPATATASSPKSRQNPVAAIRGDMTDPSGDAFGVLGTTASPDGGGVGAGNLAGGPDLILDGTEDGEADLDLYQWGLDRPSAGAERINVTNSLGGGLTLDVAGEINAQSFIGDGTMLSSVDAETLDTYDSTDFSLIGHLHDGRYYTETELNTSGAGGSVHWDNVASLPAGFADGVDHDTIYTAGVGLYLLGTEFSSRGSGYEHMVVVATAGGDFDDIQLAIDSITGASASHPFLVWVAPGVYPGPVTLKPHVHLQGAGQEATIITSTVSTATYPPDVATLVMASDSTVRDLTIENLGIGTRNLAVLASGGISGVTLARVTAVSSASGTHNYAAMVGDTGTSVLLDDVTALGLDASSNWGLSVRDGAAVTMNGGSCIARNGIDARALSVLGTDTRYESHDVTLVGEGATGETRGIQAGNYTTVTMSGGRIAATGGTSAWGADAGGASSVFDLADVTVVAQDGVDESIGIEVAGAGYVRMLGGSVTGRGGVSAWGFRGSPSGATVILADLDVVGELATGTNYGLFFDGVDSVTLNGLIVNAYSGTSAVGVHQEGAPLFASNVTTLARSGSDSNYGLLVGTGADAKVVGGTYRGRGPGTDCAGVYVTGAGTVLEARGVAGYADSGFSDNNGLLCDTAAVASWYGGILDGSGGSTASGLKVENTGTEANIMSSFLKGVGVFDSYAVNMNGGTVRVAFSKMSGNVNGAGTGTLTCAYTLDEALGTYNCIPVY